MTHADISPHVTRDHVRRYVARADTCGHVRGLRDTCGHERTRVRSLPGRALGKAIEFAGEFIYLKESYICADCRMLVYSIEARYDKPATMRQTAQETMNPRVQSSMAGADRAAGPRGPL